MDEFTLNIDLETFRSTNSLWNNLMLNDPWSIGYVSILIEGKDFVSKEEWESYYFESGKKRKKLIANLSKSNQEILEDEELVRKNKNTVATLNYNLKILNTQYGRTQGDLKKKGLILFNEIHPKNKKITHEECTECVRFRTICETWNGIIIREKNTIVTLRRTFKRIEYKKSTGESDHEFAVDYEAYMDGILVYAIQIKPQSYLGNAAYIDKARRANKIKNETYTKKFEVPVFNIISKSDGTILNGEVLTELEKTAH